MKKESIGFIEFNKISLKENLSLHKETILNIFSFFKEHKVFFFIMTFFILSSIFYEDLIIYLVLDAGVLSSDSLMFQFFIFIPKPIINLSIFGTILAFSFFDINKNPFNVIKNIKFYGYIFFVFMLFLILILIHLSLLNETVNLDLIKVTENIKSDLENFKESLIEKPITIYLLVAIFFSLISFCASLFVILTSLVRIGIINSEGFFSSLKYTFKNIYINIKSFIFNILYFLFLIVGSYILISVFVPEKIYNIVLLSFNVILYGYLGLFIRNINNKTIKDVL